ncbi:DNA-directed primase/polymerase protein [Pelomyxa schiedti]|nr:DNA-directed primase/polymerase protein [Pelomyxa schiedti]
MERARALLKAMCAGDEQKIVALQAMFPQVPPQTIAKTICEANGSLEQAVEQLVMYATHVKLPTPNAQNPARIHPVQQMPPPPKTPPTNTPSKVTPSPDASSTTTATSTSTAPTPTSTATPGVTSTASVKPTPTIAPSLLTSALPGKVPPPQEHAIDIETHGGQSAVLEAAMQKNKLPRKPIMASEVVPKEPGTTISLSGHVSPESPKSINYEFHIQGVEPTATDWVGLYIHNRQYANKYSDWQHTAGTAHGHGTFSNLLDGFYDLRLFLNGNKTNPICRSEPVLIGTEVPLSAEIVGRKVRISWLPKNATLNPTYDWIGLFLKGTKSNKKFLMYTWGSECGSVLVGPIPYGTDEYECRYFKHGSGFIYSGRVFFSIPVRDSLTVISSNLRLGESLQVRWALSTVEPHSRDWIGIFPAGAKDDAYLCYKYTHNCTVDQRDHDNGTMVFDTADLTKILPGNYDLRFFSGTTGAKLPSMSISITVSTYGIGSL